MAHLGVLARPLTEQVNAVDLLEIDGLLERRLAFLHGTGFRVRKERRPMFLLGSRFRV